MFKNGHRPKVDLIEEEGGGLAAIESDKKRGERRRQPRIITTLLGQANPGKTFQLFWLAATMSLPSDFSSCQPWKTWELSSLFLIKLIADECTLYSVVLRHLQYTIV